MSNLYINLINFNNERLAGAGYFFKRIVCNINFNDPKWHKIKNVIILSNGKIDPISLFGFNPSDKLKIVNFPFSSNFIIRIFFEQLILPFYLIGKKGLFFSPTPALPLLVKLFNPNLFVIPTIHDMIPFKIKHKYSLFRSLYVKFLSVMSAKVGDNIMTVSEFSKKDIIEIAKIASTKIHVIYNFVPELLYKQTEVCDPYFVTVCTIEPGKNIESMLRGFQLFINQNIVHSDFKYIIIGQFGWKYDSILSLVEELGLKDHVKFTGYLSDNEKNDLLSRCSGMLYLSKYEGFGIPPLEAMYFNKISIVSDRSSLPEVVGNAGIIQDPDDFNLLAKNLKQLIINSNKYKIYIPVQLLKFDPGVQVSNFERHIINAV